MVESHSLPLRSLLLLHFILQQVGVTMAQNKNSVHVQIEKASTSTTVCAFLDRTGIVLEASFIFTSPD